MELKSEKTLQQPKAVKIDETHFILEESYTYYWTMKGENADNHCESYEVENWIQVEKGFRWDGASVPKLFWNWGFKTDGAHRAAALIHDFIYVNKGKLPHGSMISKYKNETNQNQYGSFSRVDADRLFGRMMKEAGVSKFRRRLMKFAVSSFGWIYWQDGPDLMRGFIYRLFLTLMVATTLVISLKLYF